MTQVFFVFPRFVDMGPPQSSGATTTRLVQSKVLLYRPYIFVFYSTMLGHWIKIIMCTSIYLFRPNFRCFQKKKFRNIVQGRKDNWPVSWCRRRFLEHKTSLTPNLASPLINAHHLKHSCFLLSLCSLPSLEHHELENPFILI